MGSLPARVDIITPGVSDVARATGRRIAPAPDLRRR